MMKLRERSGFQFHDVALDILPHVADIAERHKTCPRDGLYSGQLFDSFGDCIQRLLPALEIGVTGHRRGGLQQQHALRRVKTPLQVLNLSCTAHE